jgi:hypothetical protein
VLQNDLAPGTDHTGAAGRGLVAVSAITERGAEKGTGNYTSPKVNIPRMMLFKKFEDTMLSIPESVQGAENENIGSAAGRTGKFA